MYPVYGGMTAYPYQRNQTPAATYYHPSWEAVPPQAKEEHPISVCTHESWPHYGYQVPMQCHSCYTHGQRPAYYDFRPPCSHFPHMQPSPPPTYNHFCGGYPPYHQPPYPMYCPPPPPPHYSVELPRYDYDKSVPRDQPHCCGCPNHTCQSERRNGVKIEEQEPEVETKKSEPLFPAGANKFSYPIVWYPPGYTSNNEQPRSLVGNESVDQQGLPFEKPQMPRRAIESEVRDNEGYYVNKKPQWSLENADPNFGYRWFPLDLNSIKRLTEGGDERKTHEEEKRSEDEKTARPVGNKDQNEQMSFPIIWVPYDKLLKNHPEDQVENKKAAEESPATFNVSPRKIDFSDNEEEKRKIAPGTCDEKTSTSGVEKKSIVRTIPVKQLDESVPKLPNKEEEHKPSSSTKKPKLPPICLRVDPPKRKNGSSRSPSPPGDKKRQDSDVSRLEVKSKQPQEIKFKGTQDITPQENKIEVSYNTSEVGGVEKKVQHDNNKSEVIQCEDGKVRVQESQASEVGVEKKEVQFDNRIEPARAQESQAEKQSEVEPEKMQRRKVMSEMEAATVIQSAYRGYDLRRWEPLKKLKLMATVREEAVQVKKNIEVLEARDALDEKTKTVIGETIMKLLLKLDTIQGLHESMRDVRRSLAKELTSLQEKLDSIMDRKQDTSNVQAAKHTPQNTVATEEIKGISETAEDLSKDSSLDGVTNAAVSERNHDNSSVQQPLPCEGDVCVSTNLVAEESLPMESPKESQDELSMGNDVGVVEDMNMKSHSISENKDQEGAMFSGLPQEVIETSAAMEPAEDVAQGNGLLSSNHDQEVNHLDPPKVDNEQCLVKTSDFQDTTHQDNETVVRAEDQEVDLLSELPREAVDEDENMIPHSEIVMEPQEGIEIQEANIASKVPREVVDEDEKVIPHSELVMEPQDRVEGQGADIISEVPREVVEEDENDMPLSEIVMESSDKIQNHEADMLSELPVEVTEERIGDTEDTAVINHDNSPPEVSVEDTQIGLEAGIVDNAANFDIPVVKEEETKLQESTAERESEVPQTENEVEDMKESKETSNEEISLAETTSLNGPRCENNDTTGVLDNIQENESETLHRNLSEVECAFDTSSIADTIEKNEQVTELLTGAQQRESETHGSETDMQQSKAVEQQAIQFSDAQTSVTEDGNEVQAEKKIKEENEKLRKLLETLLESGKEQQEVISSLSGKVKDLEKKLAKRKTKSTRHPRLKVARSYCGKSANGSLRERPMGTAS